jgi:hypothetical protein
MAEGKVNAATLAKVAKLLEAAKELVAKHHDVILEIDELLGGGAGIAEKMRQLETAFDAAWCARYAPGQTKRYVWMYTRDRPHMKRLLKLLTVDDLAARAALYLQDADSFYLKTRHPFGQFVSSVNRYAPAGAADLTLDQDARPVACVHVPACKSDQEHTAKRNREMRAVEAE